MSLSMYQASIPVLQRALRNLAAIIDKAQAHATDRKIDEAAFIANLKTTSYGRGHRLTGFAC